MRTAGLIVLIYALMHYFFGTNSLTSAWEGGLQNTENRLVSLVYGLGWLAMIVGGFLLLARTPAGTAIARAAAACMALSHVIGVTHAWSSGSLDMASQVFVFAQPVFPLFLLAVLPFLVREYDHRRSMGRSLAVLFILFGALLPWLIALAVWFLTGQVSVSRGKFGLPNIAVMSVWSALPFLALVLLDRVWPWPAARTVAVALGLAGTAAASYYGYNLIWTRKYASFIMNILPPLVFAGQTLGMLSGTLFGMIFRQRPSAG